MYPVSDAFLAMLRVPHAVAFEATIETTDGTLIPIPTVTAGEVNLDARAQVRRTGRVEVPWTVDPDDAVELGIDPKLLPFGCYLHLRRGVRYPDGSTETVPIGRFRIDAAAWKTTAAAASFELVDAMGQVADTMIHYVYTATGKTAQAAIRELVAACFTTAVPVNDSSTPTATLRDSVYHDDRVAAIAALALGAGLEVFFDADGSLTIRPVPDPIVATSGVWTVDAGEDGVLIDADEGYDRAGAINGLYIRGTGAWDQAPFEVLIVDDDAASPMRWGGPFGKVAGSLQLSAVSSYPQIVAAGAAEFRRRGGLARTLQLEAVPNPALDVGDTIEVVFPDGRVELHRVLGIRLPLNATDAMTLATASTYGAGLSVTPAERRRTRIYQGAQAWKELLDARMVHA